MSGSHETGEAKAVAVTTPAPVGIRGEVVAAYENMFLSVPDAGGEGMESILETIALADDPSELDAPWRSEGLKAFTDHELEVRAIRKAPSDFEGGLPFFLVVDAVDLSTGALVTVTTGAVSVVAQLVKAWSLGAFPLHVRVVTSERPTKLGNFPQHLEILR